MPLGSFRPLGQILLCFSNLMGQILFQAVVMRTGGDDQEANGLYRIKSTSHSLDDSSHVVAFEDRGDATNFCNPFTKIWTTSVQI